MKGLQIFLIFLFVSLQFESKAQNQYDSSKDYLVWKQGYLLNWDCYKAEADSALLSDFEALTYVSFLPIGKTEDATVVCVFDAKSSWTTSESQSLLNHHQGHFDLGELYARRIRKDLQELLANGELTEKAQLDAIERNYESYSEDFLAYNEQTSHGLDANQQKTWATKITNSLRQLSDYKID